MYMCFTKQVKYEKKVDFLYFDKNVQVWLLFENNTIANVRQIKTYKNLVFKDKKIRNNK